MNKKALEELVKPHDDGGGGGKVEITKADLRWLLGSCEWCAFVAGAISGALTMTLLIALISMLTHGGR